MFLLALPAALVAALQLGRLHPDEVYQALEPAYTRVHGYGIVAWEWRPENAIRNWAVPLVFAALLKLCDLVGLRDPQGYRAVLELPQLLLHTWALGAAFRFARRRLDSDGPALLATALIALWGMTVAFAGRTLGESISASFLLVAFEALDREVDDLRTGARGGLMLGLAVVARYGSLVFAAAGLGFLALVRRWRSLKGAVAGGVAVAVGLAVLDWVTWGAPLRSLFGYLRFNVFTGGASSFGTEPPYFYAWPLFVLSPLWVWPGLFLASRRERFQVSAPAAAALLYLVAIIATPHKESRFVYPAEALLAMAAAPAFVRWLLERARPVRAALLAAAFASGLGLYLRPPSDLADGRGDQFRAIVRAARDPGMTGLLIVGEGVWGAGGYFYIGKRTPWTVADWPQDANFQAAMRSPQINRVVTFDGQALAELQQAGFRVVGQEGRETILAR
jgi:GPI mannosyltransferase 3